MLKLKVSEASCGHCAAAIEKAINDVDPAAQVDVDLTAKVASVTTTAKPNRIREAVRLAGYENELVDW